MPVDAAFPVPAVSNAPLVYHDHSTEMGNLRSLHRSQAEAIQHNRLAKPEGRWRCVGGLHERIVKPKIRFEAV